MQRLAAPGFDVVTEGLAFPEGPVALADGSILVVEIRGRTLKRIAPDGHQQVVAALEGGPNGAASGPDGWAYVCNSGGWIHDPSATPYRVLGNSPEPGWIERIHPASGRIERLYESCDGLRLRAPNDLVFDAHGGFWFTDHGKARERERDLGSVYYARADGSMIREAVTGLMTPNGIGLSPDGGTLYVAETLTRRLLAFDVESPGVIRLAAWPAISGGRLVAGLEDAHLLDSLAVDSEGNVCVASLRDGGIVEISPTGDRRCFRPLPDHYTTNICFGGPGLQTAYVTLSSTGRLIAFPWPRPGLELNHSGTCTIGPASMLQRSSGP
jgi:gluconolactonase